jgi:glycosyltransferase involved in cell wall biosynthesis
MQRPKLIRTATVASSLDILLKGQLQFLNQYFDVIAISGQDEHLDIVKNREGVATMDIKIERKISPIKDLISLIKLYKAFKKEKPQIVHSITPKAGLLSMIAAYFAGVPVRIHTFTGLIFPSKTGFLKQLLIFLDKVLCRFATDIYPEGQGVMNDLMAFQITKKPLKIIANGNVNGIDVDFFKNKNNRNINDNININGNVNDNINGNINDNENINFNGKDSFKKKLNINVKDFVFIFVGRLVKDKGINELVSVFIKINTENPDTKLLLVGPFEQDIDPVLPEIFTAIKTHKSIISVGHQSDVRPYFSIADCLTFASYREGFPNVVMQAGAMNLPCIVTNINGCNEIIIDRQNGIIIEPKNAQSLYNAMQLVLLDLDLMHRLKSKSREMIVSRYDKNVVWDALLNEYNLTFMEHNPKKF